MRIFNLPVYMIDCYYEEARPMQRRQNLDLHNKVTTLEITKIT